MFVYVHLLERQEREICQPLLHSPDGSYSQGWTMPKLETQNSIHVTYIGGRSPIIEPSSAIRSETARTQLAGHIASPCSLFLHYTQIPLPLPHFPKILTNLLQGPPRPNIYRFVAGAQLLWDHPLVGNSSSSPGLTLGRLHFLKFSNQGIKEHKPESKHHSQWCQPISQVSLKMTQLALDYVGDIFFACLI